MEHPPYVPRDDLPAFEQPPVVEAVLGIEFAAMGDLGAVHMVELAKRWANDFPTIQELPALPPSVGDGGEPFQFGIMQTPSGALPGRFWVLSEDEETLLQLQNDRLVLNWRRLKPTSIYPRYISLRAEFGRRWGELLTYLSSVGLPPPQATYIESSFVNQYALSSATVSGSAGLSFVIDLPATMPGEGLNLNFMLRRVVTGANFPRGQLSVAGTHVSSDKDQGFQLTIVTKAQAPEDPGSLLPALDSVHDISVMAFVAATTRDQHREWFRKQ